MNQSSLAAPALDPAQLRARLRDATRDIHAALDDRFSEIGEASPRTYHAFIRMNDACHRTLEPWLRRVLPATGPAERPQFAQSLSLDMDAMALDPLPTPGATFAEDNVAEAVGVIYVLDGSRLGARVIQRQIAPCNEGGKELSMHYLNAAAAPGPVFAAFNHLASQLGELDVARSIDAARRTFALFGTMSEYAASR